MVGNGNSGPMCQSILASNKQTKGKKQMKNSRFTSLITASFTALFILVVSGCTRDDEELIPATFPTTAEVFLDAFSAGLEYLPFAGSKLDAFSVDTEEKQRGSASMRFDIPNPDDPDGTFAGAIFPDNTGRDLSGYDALTFWAKATQAGTINEIGFGNDFGENKYVVTLPNLQLSTNWKKYTIPIPDASKLEREKGLFWYSEGPEEGKGYTFWLDEVQFEKLGTVSQPRPEIFGGDDIVQESFVGIEIPIGALRETFNLQSGLDRTVIVAPAYFEFTSSNTGVATVNELGIIQVVGPGSAVVTATIGGVVAKGSITINSLGDFEFAPIPTRDSADVISIFSDAYENRPVDYYNGFWEFSSTKGGNDLEVNGDNLIVYTDLNFVGIQFATTVPTIDASQMTHFHVDILTIDSLESGDFLGIGLNDVGADKGFGGGDDSGQELRFTTPELVSGEWISLDIPLKDFTGLTNRNNLAQVIFVSDLTIPSLIVDNIYLYKDESGTGGTAEPVFAAPTPNQSPPDVISLFSDTYEDVPLDTWRTDWSAAIFEDVRIDGNATKKYSNLDFVGIESVSNPIDASAMTHLHVDVWSSDFILFGIKLVDFGADGAFGGGDDVEHQVDFDMPDQGSWVSLDIPLVDFTGLTSTGHIAQFILVGQPSGSTTVFLDNFYFYDGDGGSGTPMEPDEAAPIPIQTASNVVSIFSDAYDDITVDTWRTDWSSATLEDVTILGNATKKYSDLDFVGIETVSNPVNAADMTHFHIDVWSADFTFFGIKLVDFGADGAFAGDDDVEHQLDFEMPTQGGWVSLDIPLADFTGLTTTGQIAQFILAGQPSGSTTVYVDNVYFYDDGSGSEMLTEPDEAAPIPTLPASDVISMFSDNYEDIAVDTWRTDWSSASLEDVTILGNETKKYSDLDFVGIEMVSKPVNAEDMTHFHLNVWSADFTLLGIKLVDFGGDGVFGGGDDVEHQLDFDMPNQGKWVSLDIPLADFTSLTTTRHLAQVILVGQPTGSATVFVDNFYFHK